MISKTNEQQISFSTTLNDRWYLHNICTADPFIKHIAKQSAIKRSYNDITATSIAIHNIAPFLRALYAKNKQSAFNNSYTLILCKKIFITTKIIPQKCTWYFLYNAKVFHIFCCAEKKTNKIFQVLWKNSARSTRFSEFCKKKSDETFKIP